MGELIVKLVEKDGSLNIKMTKLKYHTVIDNEYFINLSMYLSIFLQG